MKRLNLFVVIYSKVKTVNEAKQCLKTYPEQGTNNRLAYLFSIEFRTHLGGPVGTLSEYKNDADEFLLHFDDGEVLVVKDNDRFLVKEDLLLEV